MVWESFFGGSAWELDRRTGQYYYHSFAPQMADLNWDNPDLLDAQRNDNNSVLKWVSSLIELRNKEKVFREGVFTILEFTSSVILFSRSLEGQKWVIGLNWGDTEFFLQEAVLPEDNSFIGGKAGNQIQANRSPILLYHGTGFPFR
ncbi:hypothetical protein ES705_22342 [subsurface metagenome]